MQEHYYHSCPILLENKSILKKGSYGRMIKTYTGNECNGVMLFREKILENIRQENYAHKPSRLNCIFACLSLHEIKEYQEMSQHTTSVIYKIKPVTESCKTHIGNYIEVQPRDFVPYFDNMEDVVKKYWGNTGRGNREVLLESDVIILEQI